MRIISHHATHVVDRIQTTTEVGELAKLATKFGYVAVIEPGDDEEQPGYQVRFELNEEQPGHGELINLAILVAFARGWSGDEMLAEVRRSLERRHFPLDKPIQDVMAVGGGDNHEGH